MINMAILRSKQPRQIKFNLTLSLNDSIFSAPEKNHNCRRYFDCEAFRIFRAYKFFKNEPQCSIWLRNSVK